MKKMFQLVLVVVFSAVMFTQAQTAHAPSENGKCRIVYVVKRERVQLGKFFPFKYWYIPRLVCERGTIWR